MPGPTPAQDSDDELESVLSKEERDSIKLDAREEYAREQALKGLDVDSAESEAKSEEEVQEPVDGHTSGPDRDEDEGFLDGDEEVDPKRDEIDDGEMLIPAPDSLEKMVPDRGESDISPLPSLRDDGAIDKSDDTELELLAGELSTNGGDGDDEGYGSSDDEEGAVARKAEADERAWKAYKREKKEKDRLEEEAEKVEEENLDNSPAVSEQGIQEIVTSENASPVASPMNSLPPSLQAAPSVKPPLSPNSSRPRIIGPNGALRLESPMDPKDLETFKNMPADDILKILHKTVEDPEAREALKSHQRKFRRDGSSTNGIYVDAAVNAALEVGPVPPSDDPNAWLRQVQDSMARRGSGTVSQA